MLILGTGVYQNLKDKIINHYKDGEMQDYASGFREQLPDAEQREPSLQYNVKPKE